MAWQLNEVRVEQWTSMKKDALWGAAVGLVLTLSAVVLGGAGHGSNAPFWLFFAPGAFVSAEFAFLGGGVLLYTTYSVLFGWGLRNGKGGQTLTALLLIHFAAVGLAFWLVEDSWDGSYLLKVLGLMPGWTVGAFALFAAVILAAVYLVRNYHANPDGHPHCSSCDYNLNGNTSGMCPECGHPIPTALDGGEQTS